MYTQEPVDTSIKYNSGSNSCSWKNNYNLTLSASDNVGIAYYEIDHHGNGTVDETTGSNFIPPSGWSTCTAIFRAVDHAGNRGPWTSAQHIHQDTTAPTCGSWSGESTSWTSGNRTISVGCNDSGGSGCKQSSYSVTYTGTTQTATPSFTISDNAGNTAVCSKNVNVYTDKDAPTCGSWSGESTSWTNQNRTISVGCNDSGSGCSQGSYSETYTRSTKTATSSIEIRDNVGHTTKCTKNVNVYIDKDAPTVGWMNYGGSIVDVCTNDSLAGIDAIATGYISNYNYLNWEFSSVPSSAFMAWGYKNIITGDGNITTFQSGTQTCYRWEGVATGTIGVKGCDRAGNCASNMYKKS